MSPTYELGPGGELSSIRGCYYFPYLHTSSPVSSPVSLPLVLCTTGILDAGRPHPITRVQIVSTRVLRRCDLKAHVCRSSKYAVHRTARTAGDKTGWTGESSAQLVNPMPPCSTRHPESMMPFASTGLLLSSETAHMEIRERRPKSNFSTRPP